MKTFAFYLSLVILALGLHASADNWDSENHTLKVYKATWSHSEVAVEDGSLARYRGRYYELYFVQCDADGNVLAVTKFYYSKSKNGRTWKYGHESSSLLIADAQPHQGIVELDGHVMLARLRDGAMLSATGSFVRTDFEEGNYAYIVSERGTVRADGRMARWVAAELQDGEGFDSQITTLIDSYLDDKGYNHNHIE